VSEEKCRHLSIKDEVHTNTHSLQKQGLLCWEQDLDWTPSVELFCDDMAALALILFSLAFSLYLCMDLGKLLSCVFPMDYKGLYYQTSWMDHVSKPVEVTGITNTLAYYVICLFSLHYKSVVFYSTVPW